MLRNVVLAIGLLLSPLAAMAAASGIQSANNQIGVQSISTNVDYIETGNGRLGTTIGTLDTESGPVPGFAVYLSSMGDVLFGNDYLKATFDYSSGHTNYVGSLQGGTFGSVVQTSGAIFTNFSARYGRGFAGGNASMLTPYIEIGAHQWERGVNYGETYTHQYSGLGVLAQYLLGRGLVLAVDGMYGRTSDSAIVINSGPGLIGFSGPLGNSDLYRLGISLDYALDQKLHATLGIDYSAFIYGISAVYPSGNSSIWEPDSQTKYTTFRIGLGKEF